MPGYGGSINPPAHCTWRNLVYLSLGPGEGGREGGGGGLVSGWGQLL